MKDFTLNNRRHKKRFNFKRSSLVVFIHSFTKDSLTFSKKFKKKAVSVHKDLKKQWHYFSLERKIKKTSLGTRIRLEEKIVRKAHKRSIPIIQVKFAASGFRRPIIKFKLPLVDPRVPYVFVKVASFCFLFFTLWRPNMSEFFLRTEWLINGAERENIVSPISEGLVKGSYTFLRQTDVNYLLALMPTATPTLEPNSTGGSDSYSQCPFSRK